MEPRSILYLRTFPGFDNIVVVAVATVTAVAVAIVPPPSPWPQPLLAPSSSSAPSLSSPSPSSPPLPAKQLDQECHYAAHKTYMHACGGWTTGALQHSATLARLCEFTRGNPTPIKAAIRDACA